ncbi:MAG: hypothetical protein QXJ28_03445 [Candidatus Pacearchaeota archaeon]
MIKKGKTTKKINPEQYNTYLTGSSSVFGSFCPVKEEPKDGFFTKIKNKIKVTLYGKINW